MHHLYVKHQNQVYHLFSGPDYSTTAAVSRFYSGLVPAMEDVLFIKDRVSPVWVKGGRKSAYDFARAYWGSGVVLDLRANPEPTERQNDNR